MSISNPFYYAIIIAGSICLTACEGTNPSSLRKPTTARSVEVPAPVEWFETDSGIGWSMDYKATLAAGRYVAEYEVTGGTYYHGPDYCFQREAIKGSHVDPKLLHKEHSSLCGLYVPNAPASDVRLYVYLDMPVHVRDTSTSSVESTPAFDGTTNAQGVAVQSVPAGATPLQAGLGAGVGTAVVTGILAAQRGNIRIQKNQPASGVLRRAITAS